MIKIAAKLLSIDSSSNKSGVAYFYNGKYKSHKLLDCSDDKNMDSRFEKMSLQLWDMLDTYKPNIVYVEETVVLRNAQTQRFLTRLQGVIYAWCMNNGCEFNTIRPTTWRKQLYFSQSRNVKRDKLKEQAIRYVFDKYRLRVGDDEADAICIGDAVVKLYGEE